MTKTVRKSAFWGAAFLMATSAIGPGFITQTTVFTRELRTSFGFVILVSVLLDIIIQLNIWRILTHFGERAGDLSNRVLPGSGTILGILVAAGGLVFNIGNIGGAGLGIQSATGWPVAAGALGSAVVATFIFLAKDAGKAMDIFTRMLGFMMIAMMAYVLSGFDIPVTEVVAGAVAPETISFRAIVTLVGGTVGGYISFAGAHRLIDAGVTGKESARQVNNSSIRGITIATIMRILLYLTALTVVLSGAVLNDANPAASIFESALGEKGRFVFGCVLWAAAVTSVVGCAYTSISFLKSILEKIGCGTRSATLVFIWVSALAYVSIGNPVSVLVWAGTINGFILPFALVLMLVAARKFRMETGAGAGTRLLRGAGWLAAIGLLICYLLFIFL